MSARSFLLLGIVLLNSSAHALVTAYVSFDHPDGWRCELSQGVWICQSTVEPDRRESVVLSIATMATEWDTLDNYLEYLKKPRNIKDDAGNLIRSKVTYARKRNINGTLWVDSLQHNSELPGFWARYVATVQNKLAILITYIVSDEYYSKLAPQFERMVASLKPNAEFDLNVAMKQGDGPLPGATKLGPLQKNILAERLNTKRQAVETPTVTAPEPEGEGLDLKTILILAGAGAIIFYILFRKRGGKGKPRQPPSPPSRPV